MARRAFILGGTGQIGRAVAFTFLDKGWKVVVAHRGYRQPLSQLIERGAEIVLVDREQPHELARALADGADAVIDIAAFTEFHADQLLDVQGSVGGFVVISTAGVYRDASGRNFDTALLNGFPQIPEPISEAQSTVDPSPATYATRKVALERRLLDRMVAPVTILRPCAVYGPGSPHPREWWFVKRILDRRAKIPLAYSGASRFHTTSVANIAALAHTVLDVPGQRILNVGDPEAPSVAEIARFITRHLGYEGAIVDGSDSANSPKIGTTPWSVPFPFVLDTKTAMGLGYIPATTYAIAVGATCDWLVETARQGTRHRCSPVHGDPFDYAAEGRFFTKQPDDLRS